MLTELQHLLKESYTVERELEGAGMSRVFVAHDVTLGRRIVIKLLPRELSVALSIERFRREIQIAASMRHPNIVPLLGAGEVAGTLYYTMPFIEGESIRARLKREGSIPLPEATRLCAEVADALAYAHAQGVVHRDVKPGNILLDSGHAVVTDFGIARAITESAAPLTTTGGIGTMGYMSPEQAVGDSTVDGRSDIYSLACVLYEMVTGRPPFAAGAEISQASRHASRFGRLLPVLSKALAADRSDRFDSALAFRDALNRQYRAPSRRRALIAGVGMAGMVAMTAAFFWGRTSSTPVASWNRRQVSAVGMAHGPVVSQDGQFVAFMGRRSICVADVRSGEIRQLVTGDGLSLPSWTSDGSEIAFNRMGAVYAVPRTGGPERVIIQGVGAYAIAPDGKTIAWRSSAAGLAPTWLRRADGKTVQLAVARPDTQIRSDVRALAWSPDGKWLATETARQLVVFSANGSEQYEVSPPLVYHANPMGHSMWLHWAAWSPNSDTLYFDQRLWRDTTPAVRATTRNRRGVWAVAVPVALPTNHLGSGFSSDGNRFAYTRASARSSLARYTLGGSIVSSRTPVAVGEASDRYHDFSPDGQRDAFVRDVGAGRDIYVTAGEGGFPRRVTRLSAANLHSVRWSPDGSRIAFISDGDSMSIIGIVDPASGETRQYPSRLPVSAGGLRMDMGLNALAWSPDGLRLFFGASPFVRGTSRRHGGIGVLDLRTGRDSLVEQRGQPVPLVSPGGTHLGFFFDAAGEFVRHDLHNGARDTTKMPFRANPIRWNDDGSLLMMTREKTFTELWKVWPGRQSQRLATIPASCDALSVAPDLRSVVCVETESSVEVWLATRDSARAKQ